jgi:hypothetical protein
MDSGNFYFLKDEYFIDFPYSGLMGNKGVLNGRPCFYSFMDSRTRLYWMIPISSKVQKYKDLYENKVKKYGKCDTLAFGEVLGIERAFLIQNMCPATASYIGEQYMQKKSNLPVRVDIFFEEELVKKARMVLRLHRNGVKLIFPDILSIEKALLTKT